jgi:hypothetical protein
VNVSPDSVEVLTGAQHQFTVSVGGADDPAVNWSATGGSIDNTGKYTAGTSIGNYIVIAQSVEDPTVADTSKVTVKAKPLPTITFRGNGSWASADVSAAIPGQSYFPFDYRTMDATATSGQINASASGPLLSNAAGEKAQASASSSVGLNVTFEGQNVSGGTATGSLGVMVLADGPAGSTANAFAGAFSTYRIEFAPSAPVRLEFTAVTTLSSQCATDGITNVTYGSNTVSITGGTTVTRNLLIPAGVYVLEVNINCNSEALVSTGTGGTKMGAGNFTFEFKLEPQ